MRKNGSFAAADGSRQRMQKQRRQPPFFGPLGSRRSQPCLYAVGVITLAPLFAPPPLSTVGDNDMLGTKQGQQPRAKRVRVGCVVVRDGECLLDAVDLEGVAQDREGLGRLLLHLKQLTLRIRTRSHHLTITNTHPGSQSTLRTTADTQQR